MLKNNMISNDDHQNSIGGPNLGNSMSYSNTNNPRNISSSGSYMNSSNLNFSAKLLSNNNGQNNNILYNPMNGLFPFGNNNSGSNASSTNGRFMDDSNNLINDFNNNSIGGPPRKEFNPFQPINSQDVNNNNNSNGRNYLFGTTTPFPTSYMDQNTTSQAQQNWPIMKTHNEGYSNGTNNNSSDSLNTNPFSSTSANNANNGNNNNNGNYQNVFDNPFMTDHFTSNPTNGRNNNLLLLNSQCPPTNGSVISSDNEDMMSRSSQNSKVPKKSSSLERKQAPTIATGRRNLKNETVEPDEAERRMKRRERNRRSAQKCRERKVQRTQELQAQVEALKIEANNLLRELDSWRMQAKHCVELLRQHCPHVAIPSMYFACLAEDERLSRASQVICNTNNQLNQNIQCENTDRTTETLPSTGTFSTNSGILDEQIQLDYNVSEGISASTHSIHSCTPNSNGSVEHSSSMPENINVIDSTSSTMNHSGDASMIDINANCIPRSSSMYHTPSNDIKPKDIHLKSPSSTSGMKMNPTSTPSPTSKISPSSAYGMTPMHRQLGRLPSGNNPNDLHSSSTCSSPLNFNDPFTSMAVSTSVTTSTSNSLQMKLEPM